MPNSFFLPIEKVLRSSRDKANWENLEEGKIALDKNTIDYLKYLSHKSPEIILIGPRNSGKTITAKSFGFKLLTESGVTCFYANARDFLDVNKAISEILAYERDFSNRTLFILEDCHIFSNLMKIQNLLLRLGKNRRNTVLLLTTRYLGESNSILRALAQEGVCVKMRPEEFKFDIAQSYIDQLRMQNDYANSLYFPREKTDVDDQINKLLVKLPKKNLKILDLYLQTWDPFKERLDQIHEKEVLKKLLICSDPPLSSKDAQVCLLPIYAIDQYEIGIHRNFFDSSALQNLINLGIVHCNPLKGLCRLPDNSEAPWYLKAAEHANLLKVEGIATNVLDYERHWMLKYAAVCPNPQNLLCALYDEPSIVEEIIQSSEFQENILTNGKDLLFRIGLDLFIELRKIDNVELCLQVFNNLRNDDFESIAKKGVDVIGSYITEFLNYREPWKRKGIDLAKKLMSMKSAQPKVLAKEFMSGLDSGRYGLHDLATLLINLIRMKTYDVNLFIKSLDLNKIREKFKDTRLTRYTAIMRALKKGKIGHQYVYRLTPSFKLIHMSVKDKSVRYLREMMKSLLMSERKRLLKKLTNKDFSEIIKRSTLNQLYNFLMDTIESKKAESKELGKEIAFRIIKVDISELIANANLKDIGMFIEAILKLQPQLAEKILNQIFQADIQNIIARQGKKYQVLFRLSIMLKHFSISPDVARRFLIHLTNILQIEHIQASSTVGLRWFIYDALMIDKKLICEWLIIIDRQTWQDKILESTTEEAFWLAWNLFQVLPDLAYSLISVPKIKEKIAKELFGMGLLSLCSIPISNPKVNEVQLNNNLCEPWSASKLTLILKLLCNPKLEKIALQVRDNLDLTKVRETIQNAEILPEIKELLIKIFYEFSKINIGDSQE